MNDIGQNGSYSEITPLSCKPLQVFSLHFAAVIVLPHQRPKKIKFLELNTTEINTYYSRNPCHKPQESPQAQKANMIRNNIKFQNINCKQVTSLVSENFIQEHLKYLCSSSLIC
ncbi:hypothetical protein PanWU01x14_209900 [Parasponia andersonii]|uniref:Uncharacterized protein n=1 Tax=Parasponia andersonii TaxID=3476 RepID=A0A2P5BUB2_PARAD|nr:hypothetical protein PanWU01x14_209900 [Parasponia andersonii]